MGRPHGVPASHLQLGEQVCRSQAILGPRRGTFLGASSSLRPPLGWETDVLATSGEEPFPCS